MRRKWIAIALLSLVSCASASAPQTPSSEWLVGTWLMLDPDAEFPLECESGLPINYMVDGTYMLFGEVGTWRLEGATVHETATETTGTGDPSDVEIGRPYVSTLHRISQDRFLKRFENGQVGEFRRCPEVK